ncbi:MAG: esterase [Christensenellales bacterium]|jgi:hypothetical protein
MEIYEYGNPNATDVLIQPVTQDMLCEMEQEAEKIRQRTQRQFRLIAVKVNDWNEELSPWKAPAVFKEEAFGGCAVETLKGILELCREENKRYSIGGYSLAALFALWASYQTERFCGVAAASPSVWFPGFMEYMNQHETKSKAVYLSLGDKEEKTKHPVLSTVGDCIRTGYERLREEKITCTLEWNRGNHFQQPEIRTAKAFAWVLENRP